MNAEILKQVASEGWKLLGIVAPRMGAGAFAGFLVGLCAVIFLGRRRWFVRQPALWNVAAKLHYLYLPLLLLSSGAAFGCLWGAQRVSERAVETHLLPLMQAQAPKLQRFLRQHVDWGTQGSITLEGATEKISSALSYEPRSSGWTEQSKAWAINYVVMNFGRWFIKAGVSSIAQYALKEAGKPIGLGSSTAEFSVEVIRDFDLASIDQALFQLLARAMQDAMRHLFRALYADVSLLLLAALAVPAIEVGGYFAWRRYRQSRPAAPAVA